MCRKYWYVLEVFKALIFIWWPSPIKRKIEFKMKETWEKGNEIHVESIEENIIREAILVALDNYT